MVWIFRKRRKAPQKAGRPEITEQLKEEYRTLFGDNLLSIALYNVPEGSRDGFEGQGISLLIVFKKLDPDTISHVRTIVADLSFKDNLSPLLVEEEELFDVASCFPVELLAAKERYEILYGKDVLKDLIVSAEDLALKAKLEIMKFYVRGRHTLAFSHDDPALLLKALTREVPHCVNALRALLIVKKKHAPVEASHIVERAAEEFSIDAAVLGQALKAQEGGFQGAASEILDLFFQYLRELYFAYKAADELSLKEIPREPFGEGDDRSFIE
jgi:hypothetical protein